MKKQHGGAREGAGRKPLPAADRADSVQVWLPAALVERIDAAAAERGTSRSALIREMLAEQFPPA